MAKKYLVRPPKDRRNVVEKIEPTPSAPTTEEVGPLADIPTEDVAEVAPDVVASAVPEVPVPSSGPQNDALVYPARQETEFTHSQLPTGSPNYEILKQLAHDRWLVKDSSSGEVLEFTIGTSSIHVPPSLRVDGSVMNGEEIMGVAKGTAPPKALKDIAQAMKDSEDAIASSRGLVAGGLMAKEPMAPKEIPKAVERKPKMEDVPKLGEEVYVIPNRSFSSKVGGTSYVFTASKRIPIPKEVYDALKPTGYFLEA